MVIFVDEIGPEGLELDAPVEVGLLKEALDRESPETGFRPMGGAQLKASLRRVSGGVLLEGRVSAPLVAPCKRCLADVRRALPVAFPLSLVARAQLAADGLVALPADAGARLAGC